MFRLCVVKPDGLDFTIDMYEKRISIDDINKQILLFENYQYKVIVQSDEIFENAEMYIGDYPVQLLFNDMTGCYETSKELLFEGCFDLAYITLYITDSEGNEKIWYTDFLRVATTKQTASQVEAMLNEIEESLPSFLDVCFSRNRKKSGLVNNDIRSIWNTLKLLDEIIAVYEENYGNFRNYRREKVISSPILVDSKQMRMIDQEGLQWISRNPDYLCPSGKNIGILFEKTHYLPTKIKTNYNQYSYEVYENKVILGFLKEILKYIEIQVYDFQNQINVFQSIPQEIVKQLPNTHELTGRCIFVYYKGVINKFKEKSEIFLRLFYKYEKLLMCTPLDITYIPALTNTFKQVYHYQVCYECIVKWYEAGDYSFEHLNYLFKLKTLSRVFEYYCLIKLQNALLLNGYELKGAFRNEYSEDDVEDVEEDINNKYIFSNGKYELTLHYEPHIQTKKLNRDMNLYSTGYNFTKAKWNDGWTPDFVIKIVGESNEYYLILDAKYSNFNNVKKRHMPELVLKYGTQIASNNKFYSDVIGIGAIYPNDNDKLYYYKKNNAFSNRRSMPVFFSVSVENSEEGNVALKNRIKELLDIVDVLEHDMPQNGGVSTVEKISLIDEKEDVHPKEKVIAHPKLVSGKRCQYYGRGKCLIKREACTVLKGICYEYKQKDDSVLIKRDQSCRFLKMGVKQSTCNISDKLGCIGTDICMFYQQRNKQK